MGTDYVEITRLEIAIWVKNSSLVKTPGKGYPFRPILATSSKRSTLAKSMMYVMLGRMDTIAG